MCIFKGSGFLSPGDLGEKMERISIFDTTLRDGEQSPGVSLTAEEKLEIARQLELLGVDVIEAGFPATSQGDLEAVKKIAKIIKEPVICALARAHPEDIKKAGEALREAKRGRIHTFIATSPIHIKYKLKKEPGEVLELAVEGVKLAKRLAPEVEFSPEDATRSEFEFLKEVLERVIEVGAQIINIPDTVGYTIPEEFENLIRRIKKEVKGADKICLSVHCHNDLGLATANSLAGIRGGARQIECTLNGIGERAGNASLEEVVMAIKTRKDFFGFTTRINTKEIYRSSRLVSRLTGMPVQPNKAIVGENAFRHESGIHQDGILKKESTYEIISPREIGLKKGELVLGKLSGRHAFKEKLKSLGFKLEEEQLEIAFQSFKELADKKKEIYDEDLLFLVEEVLLKIPEEYSLEYLHTVSGKEIIPTATVKLKKDNKIIQEASCGDGPVDAAYRAIDRVVGIKTKLLEYSLHSVTRGKDALGEVWVKVEAGKDMVTGRGASTDIVEASAKAYLNALNKLIYRRKRRKEGGGKIKRAL